MQKNKTGRESRAAESLASLVAYLSFGKALQDDELLRLIMEIGVSIMGVEEGSLLLLDREKEELEFMMTIGGDAAERALKGQRFSMHKGLTGLAASTGEPQTGAPIYRGVKQRRHKEGDPREPAAVLAAPMQVKGEVIGVITAVSFKEGRTFTPQETELYCKFATLCGTVIEQRRREETMRHILLGEKDAAAASRVRQILGRHDLATTDQAVIDIAQNLGRLSQGREDIMAICAELIRIIARIADELARRPGHG